MSAIETLPFFVLRVFPPSQTPFFGTGNARTVKPICFAEEAKTVPMRWLKNNAEPGSVIDPPRLWSGGLIRVVSAGPGRVKPEIWNGVAWVAGGTLLDADRGIPADPETLSRFGLSALGTVCPTAKEHIQRCQAYQAEGRFEDALREATAALLVDTDNADAYYGLGHCYHALARNANQQVGGNIYFSAGLEHLESAITAFRKVAALQPNAPDAFSNLGLACDNACRLDEAEKYYREAIRLDPSGIDGADACWNLALLLYMRSRGCAGQKRFAPVITVEYPNADLEAAFAMAEEAVQKAEGIARSSPDQIETLVRKHRTLAHWYQDNLLGEDAIPHFQAVLKLNPRDTKAIEWLREAEQNTGRKLL